jgi:hypothetical protein
MVMKFVVCIDNTDLDDFSTDDLTIGRLYEVVDNVDMHGMLRIIDDSGEGFSIRRYYSNRWKSRTARPNDCITPLVG